MCAHREDGDGAGNNTDQDALSGERTFCRRRMCIPSSLLGTFPDPAVREFFDSVLLEFYDYDVGPTRYMCAQYLPWLCESVRMHLETRRARARTGMGSLDISEHARLSGLRHIHSKAKALLSHAISSAASASAADRARLAYAVCSLGPIAFFAGLELDKGRHADQDMRKNTVAVFSSVHGAHVRASRAWLNGNTQSANGNAESTSDIRNATRFVDDFAREYGDNLVHIHPDAAAYDLRCVIKQYEHLISAVADSESMAQALTALLHRLKQIAETVQPANRQHMGRDVYLSHVRAYTACDGFLDTVGQLEQWYDHLLRTEESLTSELVSLGSAEDTAPSSSRMLDASSCNWSCSLSSEELTVALQRDVDTTLSSARSSQCRWSEDVTRVECRVKLGASYTSPHADPFDRESLSDGPQYHMASPKTPYGSLFISRPHILRRVIHPANLWVVLAHECSPGHHVQVCAQMGNANLPDFKRYRMLGFVKSFSEGWGLYAEQYAKRQCFVSALHGRVLGEEAGVDERALRTAVLEALRLRYRRAITDMLLHFFQWPIDKAANKYDMDDVYIRRMLYAPGQMCAYVAGFEAISDTVRNIVKAEARRGVDEQRATVRAHNFILSMGETPLNYLRDAARIMFEPLR